MLAMAILSGSVGSARADVVLVSNVSEPLRFPTPIANPVYWAAQSFSVDADYTLTSISAILGGASGTPEPVIELRTSVAGEIDLSAGGLLATFTAPDLSGTESLRIFTPESTIVLAPDTQYWFMVGAATGDGFDWWYVETNVFEGPGSLLVFADSDDGGATFINRDFVFPYTLEVRGDPVDTDGDTIPDATDNCLYAANARQEDVGGVGAPPDGDACQCGDINDDGNVTAADVTVLRRALISLSPYFSIGGPANGQAAPGIPVLEKCNVGAPGDALATCTASDSTIIARALGGLSPGITQSCAAALP
jgi:hypothetical protein